MKIDVDYDTLLWLLNLAAANPDVDFDLTEAKLVKRGPTEAFEDVDLDDHRDPGDDWWVYLD